ncbi:GerAB/ArcD/ProY family transporter [Gottfriedia solisilvae]|uniref:GerAB/ArcD/ProY family transporter n=1 Tax=Gottfriedia solisilvae TaxID=1516104 RepID=UPI003D2F076D
MDRSFQVVIMYILTHLSLIFFMYPRNIIASTGEGHWLPIMIGLIFHFLFIAIYMKGLSYFPNKDLITIYLGVGKFIAIIFLLPITLYFIMIIIITIRAYSEIITIVFLSKTPLWAIMAFLLFISTYLASKEVESIFRTGALIAFLFLPLIILIFGSSIQNVDWHYLFPIVDKQFTFFTSSSFYVSFFAVGGGFLFLGFIQPYLSYQRKKILIGALFLIPCFILSVYIPILTFGQATASTFMFPFVMALDTVELDWIIFDRVTMFFLMSLITFIMLYISLVLWKTIRIINVCFPSVKPIYLTIILSVFIFLLCLLIPNWNDIERIFFWNTYLRFYVICAVPISVLYFGMRIRKEGNNENF